ncbi:TraB/GumN family protein [Oricola thermophila]|uniref:TraB/GumN family protein n=1 Tax=Oricola thermophila TaxID=2742145 RepID=A0A6N1VL68_9HYPH|nr:TraB/GumN family protein [Oricola thermophila]QKV19959.1 TraB/GumN family protein [Oricola thermophila]
MNGITAYLDRLSGPILAALGLANALFVASFLVVLFVAAQALPAASAEACGGENLLIEMQHDDPDAYAALLEEAARTVNGDTLLFRVEKDGVEPSWLFGTMHLTDPRVTAMPPAAEAAFAKARAVAIESTEILDPAKAQMALFSKPELTMFTDGKGLSDYLDEGQRAILEQGLAERGVQLALVERMKPWLITAMVALPECEMERKKEGQPFLDIRLAQDAEREGKDLVGLETIVEQFEAMASLPMEFHVSGLVDSLRLGDRVDDVIETMIALYAEGRTGAVWPMLRWVTADVSGGDTDAGYAEFEETMVHVRNETMVKRARPLFDAGGAFVAVGALHLPGEKGIAALLEEAGYTVTPVY